MSDTIVAPTTAREEKRTQRVDDLIYPAVERVVMASNILSVEADPEAARELSRGIATGIIQDRSIANRVDAVPTAASPITWNHVTGFVLALYAVWTTIELQLPLAAGEFFRVDPIFAAIGAAGTQAVPLLKRWFPGIADLFPAATAATFFLLAISIALSVAIGIDPAYAQTGGSLFQRYQWLWAIPGLPVAAGIGWLVARAAGWKVGFIAFLAVLGIVALKVITAGAYRRGQSAAREVQRRADEDAINRAQKARAKVREETNRTGGAIDEDDPNLRD